MGQTDLQLRNKAIPFQGQIHQLNSTPLSSQRISMAQTGDLFPLANLGSSNTTRYFPVRFLKPHAAQMIQSYFTARIRLAAGNSAQVWIGPVMFSDDLTPWTLDTTVEAAIKEYHRQIFGTAGPIAVAAGGLLEIDAANLSKFLTDAPGSPLYSKHFFGVTILFAAAPDMTGTYDVMKFKIDASANFGGL